MGRRPFICDGGGATYLQRILDPDISSPEQDYRSPAGLTEIRPSGIMKSNTNSGGTERFVGPLSDAHIPDEAGRRTGMKQNYDAAGTRRLWVSIFLFAAVALSVAGYKYYSFETERIRQDRYSDLAAIAKLKVGQIREWRKARLADVRRLAKDPLFRRAVQAFLREPGNPAVRAALKESLDLVRNEYGYADALLLDTQHRVLLSAEPKPHLLGLAELPTVEKAIADGLPRLCDLCKDSQGNIFLDAVGPISGDEGIPAAVLVLRSDAESVVYPLIESWPTPSRTAETLVVRKEGDTILFLNDLRHRPNSALTFREPMTLIDLPAVQAVKGKEGIFEGKDYRRVNVLADLRPIPDSSWFMVAKVDSDEILAEARYRGGAIALFAFLFVLLAAAVTAYGYRHRQAGLYRELYRWERIQRETQEEFETILYSIGDAVITTDTTGLVKQMNGLAERLSGWSESEAKGEPLERIFRIINEDSRATVEDPVQRVLREQTVIGLANHTLLIARDDTERPIADSGAPVRDEDGKILGVVLVFRDQTEERKSKKELEESEERYRTVADHTYDWEYWLTPDGRLGYCSPSCERITGYKADEFVNDPALLSRIVHPEDRALWKHHALHVEPSSELCELDYRIVTRAGDVTWIAHCCCAVYSESGKTLGHRVSNRDISDRKLMEAALKESEKKFRLMYEEAPIAYQSLDHTGRLLDVNYTWLELMGYTREEVVGREFPEFMTPDSRRHYEEIFKEFLLKGSVQGVEYEVIRKDGSVIDISLVGRISRGEDGDSKQTHCVFQDITQRKRMEAALRESEQRYRATFDNAAVGIDLVDRHGRFLEANETLAKFLGYTQEELRKLNVMDITHPEDVARSAQMLEALVAGDGKGYRVEKRYVRKDETIVWADTSVSSILGAEGDYKATVGVIVDISRRKEYEEALLRLATAVEQAAESVVMTDTDGTIVYVNPAFERTTGYSREEVVGNTPRILKSDRHDDEFYKGMWKTISGGKIWTGHLINKKKDGTLFEEDVSISPVKDAAGKTVNYVALKRDVTHEVSLQKQLLQAQKMEAIGTLAGGIAHDFNNLLQVTLGYSELLLAEKSAEDEEYSDLQKILHAARSGAELVRSLLAFSRKVEPKPIPMSLNKQIKHVEKFLRRTIPKMIDIRLELAEDLARTNADPAQIEQVIMNLAVNGRDAMGEEGTLTIRTENVALDAEYCRLQVEAQPGDYLLLSVSDTGQGMDKETLQHIFEPFYTTKEIGRGTGLGLAMVYGTVKLHGGHVSCYSEPGEGTTFKVYLPAIVTEPEVSADDLREMPASGTETVLLVDDEDSVRELGLRILEKAGYTVLTAPNGRAAVDLYMAKRDEIALVILDLIMPIMGGKDCLTEILGINPMAKIMISSGYAADASARECAELGARGFVAKPFRLMEILTQVRSILDQG